MKKISYAKKKLQFLVTEDIFNQFEAIRKPRYPPLFLTNSYPISREAQSMKTFNEWFKGNTHAKQFFPSMLKEDYEEGDILHFWYLFNQDSPAVKKFVLGLSALMDESFPEEHKYAEVIEYDDSPIAHRYICVRHESDE